MSINQDIRTLGKDLTNEARGAGDVAVGQTKNVFTSAKTPLYAVIGASDHAAKSVAAVRPHAIRAAVREVIGEAVSTARKSVRRYEKRGQMVVADLRRAPGFTRVVIGAENAVDLVEDTLEDGTTKTTTRKAKATTSRAARPATAKRTPAKHATAKQATRRSTPSRASANK